MKIDIENIQEKEALMREVEKGNFTGFIAVIK